MKGEGINNLDPDRSRMTDLSVCLVHCYHSDGSAAEAERRTALAPPEAKTFRGTRKKGKNGGGGGWKKGKVTKDEGRRMRMKMKDEG